MLVGVGGGSSGRAGGDRGTEVENLEEEQEVHHGGRTRRHVLIMLSLRRRRTRKKFNEDCARYF